MFDPSTLLLLAALAAPIDSTAHAAASTDSVLVSVVAPLIQPGDRLRVRTGFEVTEGVAGWVGPGGLELRRARVDGSERSIAETIAWPQIERIERESRNARNGAKVGAAFGCLIGLAAVMSAAAYSGPFGGSGPGGGELLLAGIAGGVAGGCAGGIVGGLVGSLLPSWRTIYERR